MFVFELLAGQSFYRLWLVYLNCPKMIAFPMMNILLMLKKHQVILYLIISYYITLHFIELHYLISCYIISYYIILYYIILCYITLHYIILYPLFIIFYYVIHVILYYFIFYYITLYFIILYFIILVGYQTAFSELMFAGRKEHDPFHDISDPKDFLAKRLYKLSLSCPGKVC